MSYNFHFANREQAFLLPPAVTDWLSEDHLAWFILDAVEQMDMTPFLARYRQDGAGATAFDPAMMVALLLYSYCHGERSSRQIERLCETDIAFRVITGNLQPDHTTIARFRRNHAPAIEGLFVDILRLCKEAGLVKMGFVALDGSKIKANAALDANRTHNGLVEEVKRMLDEAEAKDAEEDGLHGARRGDEPPAALRGRENRLARLKECRERLEREAAEKAAAQAKKLATRQAEEEASGQKKRGRKPAPPESAPAVEAKANVTDPESRIMKTRNGFIQGYNAQAAVNAEQIVVAAEVTQEANDVRQLKPLMKAIQATTAAAGIDERVGVCAADAGYWSAANGKKDGRVKTEYLLSTTKDWKQRKKLREEGAPVGRIPMNATWQDLMERRLRTKRGRELYRKRSTTVEPVFGQIKDARGIDRFLLRGLAGSRVEWKLICGTHNLLKLWRKNRAYSTN